jgi:hypothetical protein
LDRQEIILGKPNQRVILLAADNPRIKRGYSVLAYCHNDKRIIDQSSKIVVLYDRVWHVLGHSISADRPTLGEPLVDIHKYDEPEEPIEPPPVYMPVAPATLNPIKEEQQMQLLIRLDTPVEERPKQGQEDSSSGSSKTDTDTTDKLDQEIRNSPIVTQ